MHGRSMEHSTVRADALVGMHAARGCARKHACSAERAWMGLRRHACGSMHEVLRSLRSSVHSGLPALLRSHVELDDDSKAKFQFCEASRYDLRLCYEPFRFNRFSIWRYKYIKGITRDLNERSGGAARTQLLVFLVKETPV